MDIKGIVCRLATPQYKIGFYVCLGSLGGQGVLCSIESLQAAGLAVMAMSFWQGARVFYESCKDAANGRDGVSKEKEEQDLALLNKALLNAEQKQQECWDIGYKYLHGIGVARDFKQAFDSFYEGAKLGSAQCATEVGYFYEQGRYKAQNMFLARYWFERGAMGNNAEACFRLAYFYATHHHRLYKGRLSYFLDKACCAHVSGAQKLKQQIQMTNANVLAETITKVDGQVLPSAIYDYAHRDDLRKYIYKGGTCSPAVIKLALEELGFKPDDFKDFDFSEESLRPAYIKRMHTLHPDANGGDDTHAEEIERLKRAYKLLLKLEG